MGLLLTVISGLAWTVVYVEAIRLGFRDRTYAIPVAALALNFAWEVTYTVQAFTAPLGVQAFVNLTWALADLVIVYTYFRFGRHEFDSGLTQSLFVSWSVILFGSSFVVQWLFLGEFGFDAAVRYSAFLQNLLMSCLFLAMLMVRRSLRGQSLTVAVAKWIGTLAPTLLFGVIERSGFILGLGVLCSVFDLVYIGMLVWARTHFGATAVSRVSAESAP
jgi:hypothetical protein